jgi:hypothetical protein
VVGLDRSGNVVDQPGNRIEFVIPQNAGHDGNDIQLGKHQNQLGVTSARHAGALFGKRPPQIGIMVTESCRNISRSRPVYPCRRNNLLSIPHPIQHWMIDAVEQALFQLDGCQRADDAFGDGPQSWVMPAVWGA